MSLHPEVEKMIEAGKIESAPYADGQVDIETDEEFARRIAALQQELEREECAKMCEDRGYHAYNAVELAAAIRRRGKP